VIASVKLTFQMVFVSSFVRHVLFQEATYSWLQWSRVTDRYFTEFSGESWMVIGGNNMIS